jgi:hypothetical protein
MPLPYLPFGFLPRKKSGVASGFRAFATLVAGLVGVETNPGGRKFGEYGAGNLLSKPPSARHGCGLHAGSSAASMPFFESSYFFTQ